MKKYIILYFTIIAHMVFGFLVLMKTLKGDFELWRVIFALTAFFIFLILTVFFLARLRKMNGE